VWEDSHGYEFNLTLCSSEHSQHKNIFGDIYLPREEETYCSGLERTAPQQGATKYHGKVQQLFQDYHYSCKAILSLKF